MTVIWIFIWDISCGPPPQASHASHQGSSYLLGNNVTFTCDEGYSLHSGDLTRICQADHTWSGQTPVCGKYLHSRNYETLNLLSNCSNTHVDIQLWNFMNILRLFILFEISFRHRWTENILWWSWHCHSCYINRHLLLLSICCDLHLWWWVQTEERNLTKDLQGRWYLEWLWTHLW